MHMDSTLAGTVFMPQNHITPGGERADEINRGESSRADSNRGVEIDSSEANYLQARIAAIMGENQQLRAEIERIRAERAKMSEIQSRLMDVLGTKSPDRLVHDVRNVMNERELYRALADSM